MKSLVCRKQLKSSCIDVFDYFARTMIPPMLSKLQGTPDVSHEEFRVCLCRGSLDVSSSLR